MGLDVNILVKPNCFSPLMTEPRQLMINFRYMATGTLDFLKASDKVSHNRLKHKLNFYGIRHIIRGNILAFG